MRKFYALVVAFLVALAFTFVLAPASAAAQGNAQNNAVASADSSCITARISASMPTVSHVALACTRNAKNWLADGIVLLNDSGRAIAKDRYNIAKIGWRVQIAPAMIRTQLVAVQPGETSEQFCSRLAGAPSNCAAHVAMINQLHGIRADEPLRINAVYVAVATGSISVAVTAPAAKSVAHVAHASAPVPLLTPKPTATGSAPIAPKVSAAKPALKVAAAASVALSAAPAATVVEAPVQTSAVSEQFKPTLMEWADAHMTPIVCVALPAMFLLILALNWASVKKECNYYMGRISTTWHQHHAEHGAVEHGHLVQAQANSYHVRDDMFATLVNSGLSVVAEDVVDEPAFVSQPHQPDVHDIAPYIAQRDADADLIDAPTVAGLAGASKEHATATA